MVTNALQRFCRDAWVKVATWKLERSFRRPRTIGVGYELHEPSVNDHFRWPGGKTWVRDADGKGQFEYREPV